MPWATEWTGAGDQYLSKTGTGLQARSVSVRDGDLGRASTWEGSGVIHCIGRGGDIGAGGVQWEPSFVGVDGLYTQGGVYMGGVRPSICTLLRLHDLEKQ